MTDREPRKRSLIDKIGYYLFLHTPPLVHRPDHQQQRGLEVLRKNIWTISDRLKILFLISIYGLSLWVGSLTIFQVTGLLRIWPLEKSWVNIGISIALLIAFIAVAEAVVMNSPNISWLTLEEGRDEPIVTAVVEWTIGILVITRSVLGGLLVSAIPVTILLQMGLNKMGFALIFLSTILVTVYIGGWAYPPVITTEIAKEHLQQWIQIFDRYESLCDRAYEIEDANENFSIDYSDYDPQDYRSLRAAEDALDNFEEEIDQMITKIENRDEELKDELTNHVSAANDALAQQNLDLAQKQITNAKEKFETLDALVAGNDYIQASNLEQIKSDIQKTANRIEREQDRQEVEDKAESIRTKISRAETALNKNSYEEARTDVETAAQKLSSLKKKVSDLALEDTVDVTELESQIMSLSEKINQKEQSDQIQRIRDLFSEILDVDSYSNGGIPLESENFDQYSELIEILNRISSLQTEYPNYPWDTLVYNLISELPNVSNEFIHECQQILTNSKQILSFLDTVSDNHPSVDAEEWHDAVVVALEEQYVDILRPICEEIDRLKGSLWEREYLFDVSPTEFEQLVGSLYESRGWSVEVTQETADLGVDIWIEKGDETGAIQVKQYDRGNTVGRQTLQQIVSTLAKGDANLAIVVTSSEFAQTAQRYAEDFGAGLEIVNGEELVDMLSVSDVPPPV